MDGILYLEKLKIVFTKPFQKPSDNNIDIFLLILIVILQLTTTTTTTTTYYYNYNYFTGFRTHQKKRRKKDIGLKTTSLFKLFN